MDTTDPKRRRTVLLAEDEAGIRKLISKVLKVSFNVLVASTGTEALRMSDEFGGDIDLLISDVEMPGMTGIELGTQLHLRRPKTKVLLMSGLDPVLPVLDEGWHFIDKPFSSHMLIAKIKLILESQKIDGADEASQV